MTLTRRTFLARLRNAAVSVAALGPLSVAAAKVVRAEVAAKVRLVTVPIARNRGAVFLGGTHQLRHAIMEKPLHFADIEFDEVTVPIDGLDETLRELYGHETDEELGAAVERVRERFTPDDFA